MSGVLLGAAVLAALIGSATLLSTAVGIHRVAELALAVYLLVFAEIVGLSLLLSVFGALTRVFLVAGAVVLLAVSAAVWRLAGSPRPPGFPSLGSLRPWPLVTLAAVTIAAFAYVAALVVGTPPNGWDQLNYHLARAAFWLQSERVGYIEAAYDPRLNFNPPNAEVAMAFVLGVTREEVLTGFVQLAAALACALAVYVLARRIGLDRREGLFGALLLLLTPIVLVQSATPKNDLVVASLLLAAAVFVLGDSRTEIALASLGTALAMGTKLTGLYGVVVLLALAVLAEPRGRWKLRVVAVAAGAMLGSYWYAVNLAETDRVLGEPTHIELTAPLQPPENLLQAYGLALDAIDLSGAEGRDILLFLVAAALVGLGLLWRRVALLPTAFAACLVASPLVLLPLSTDVLRRGFYKLNELLDYPAAFLAIDNAQATSPTTASASDSWFGPAGLFLSLGVAVAAVLLHRRAQLPRVALVLAAAPVAWFLMLALTLTYHPFQGRFFVFPVALSASLWGLALRIRPLAWAAVALTATTALLSLVHNLDKPSGLRLLDRTPVTSVWTTERWEVQSGHAPQMAPIYRYLDEVVPREDPVALALGFDGFGYPVFGPHLERHVELVPLGSDASEVVTPWLVASPERRGEIDAPCWRRVLDGGAGGSVFRRVTPDCAR